MSYKREQTIAKHRRLKERFKQLHDVERIRIDDVVQQLADEFFFSPATVERILYAKDNTQ